MVHASISLGAVAARRVSSHVEPFAARKAFPISLRQLIFFGRDVNRDKLVTAGNFIRTELPVRLAHRIKDLEVLPYVVGSNPVIKPVFERYVDAFERIRTYPVIRTFEDNLQFCEFMKGLLEEHLVIIPLLARALQDSAKETPASQLDAFMAKMLRSRISRRILTQQHIALSEQYASGSFERGAASDRFVGVVDNRLCPAEVAERCARLVTSAMIDEVPEHEHAQLRFDIDGNTKATFSYLPEHLEYILFELYRNSAKATLARHGDHACEHPISTTICESGTDMLIRVSDQAGGIPPFDLDRPLTGSARLEVFSFVNPRTFSSGQSEVERLAATVAEQRAVKGQMGLGLGLSRMYAEFFGGDLDLYSLPEWGSDAFVRIPLVVGKQDHI